MLEVTAGTGLSAAVACSAVEVGGWRASAPAFHGCAAQAAKANACSRSGRSGTALSGQTWRRVKHARRLANGMWRRQGVPAHPTPPADLPAHTASQPAEWLTSATACRWCGVCGCRLKRKTSAHPAEHAPVGGRARVLRRPVGWPAHSAWSALACGTRSAWPATPGTWSLRTCTAASRHLQRPPAARKLSLQTFVRCATLLLSSATAAACRSCGAPSHPRDRSPLEPADNAPYKGSAGTRGVAFRRRGASAGQQAGQGKRGAAVLHSAVRLPLELPTASCVQALARAALPSLPEHAVLPSCCRRHPKPSTTGPGCAGQTSSSSSWQAVQRSMVGGRSSGTQSGEHDNCGGSMLRCWLGGGPSAGRRSRHAL